MKPDIVITGMAMATPLGLNAVQTCASVRAGIVRFKEFYAGSHVTTMATVPDECLPKFVQKVDDNSLTQQEQRLIQLAALACTEISEIIIRQRMPLILGLPQDNGTKPLNSDKILKYIMQMGLNIEPAQISAITKGRASGLIAVHSACKLLESGKADIVLAGGCDSYNDTDILDFLDSESRLKSEIHLDSFIPGEGVGFLLLTTESKAKREKLNILGRIKSTAIGFEKGHLYSEIPYKGEGLFQTFQSLLKNAATPIKCIKTIYSSMNGENHWAKELNVSYIRFQSVFAEDLVVEHPADCYGDIGAASGPVMMGLAINALQKGYQKGPILIYASSDQGDRGAVILDMN